jgi:F0F1-type ATP synthase membrane subunit b/b'
MFLSLDGTFWVQLINFAIFFALLNVVFLRSVGEAIRKRRAYINALADDYSAFQAQAADLRQKAESVRASARRDAELAIAKGRAEASNRTAALAGDYAKEAQAIVERAHLDAEAELDKARVGEDRLVRSLADDMLARAVPELVS